MSGSVPGTRDEVDLEHADVQACEVEAYFIPDGDHPGQLNRWGEARWPRLAQVHPRGETDTARNLSDLALHFPVSKHWPSANEECEGRDECKRECEGAENSGHASAPDVTHRTSG